MFSRFVKALRIAQKTLVLTLRLIVAVLGVLTTVSAESGEFNATA